MNSARSRGLGMMGRYGRAYGYLVEVEWSGHTSFGRRDLSNILACDRNGDRRRSSFDGIV